MVLLSLGKYKKILLVVWVALASIGFHVALAAAVDLEPELFCKDPTKLHWLIQSAPDSNGDTSTQCMLDEKPDGPYETRFSDGKIRTQGFYKNGHKSGEWQSFYAGGAPRERGLYDDDVKICEWRYWSLEGALTLSKEKTCSTMESANRAWYRYARVYSDSWFQSSGSLLFSGGVAWAPQVFLSRSWILRGELGAGLNRGSDINTTFLVLNYEGLIGYRLFNPLWLSVGGGAETWLNASGTSIVGTAELSYDVSVYKIDRIFLSYSILPIVSPIYSYEVKLGLGLKF